VLSGSSFISQSDLRQHFGLGQARKADAIEIRWPGGQAEKVADVGADQFVTVVEGRGRFSTQALMPPGGTQKP